MGCRNCEVPKCLTGAARVPSFPAYCGIVTESRSGILGWVYTLFNTPQISKHPCSSRGSKVTHTCYVLKTTRPGPLLIHFYYCLFHSGYQGEDHHNMITLTEHGVISCHTQEAANSPLSFSIFLSFSSPDYLRTSRAFLICLSQTLLKSSLRLPTPCAWHSFALREAVSPDSPDLTSLSTRTTKIA